MKHDFDARQYSDSHIYISCFLKCHRQRQSMLVGSQVIRLSYVHAQ